MKEKRNFLLVFLAGFIVYFPSLFNGFVGDDFLQIVHNTSVHSLGNLLHFFAGSTFASGGSDIVSGLYYRPLMLVLFSLLYSFFHLSPLPYHLLQLVVHLLNGGLLFLFLRRFFRPSYVFILVFLFLVHPISSEAVLYSANLQDVLFFFFGMLSLLLIQLKDYRYRMYILLFGCFLLSLLSKESGILFISMALLYSFLFQRKNFLVVFFASVSSLVFYLFLRYGFAKMYLAQGSVAPIFRALWQVRMMQIPALFFYYLKTFFLPFWLGIDQYWIITNSSFADFFLPLVVSIFFVVLIVLGAYVVKKRKASLFPSYVFFCIWFFIGMLLHLQIIPLDATVADRWFYFPFVGLLGMLGIIVSLVPWRKLVIFRYLPVFLGFICLSCCLVTFFRCFNWRDDLSLYSHDITTTRQNFILDNAYATALIGNDQFAEAKPYALRSLREYPYYANLNNMGIISVSEKKYSQAQVYFRQAVSMSRNYMVYENYSSFLFHYNTLIEARLFTKRALQLFPHDRILLANWQKITRESK